MNKLSKKIEAGLQLIAGNLPVVMEETKEYHFLKGSELKEMEIFKDDKGNDIVDEKEYRWAFPVQIAWNHYRKLRKAFKHGGEPEVIQYINKVADLAAA